MLIDGETTPLTYKEFELLQFLVLREGRTIDRHEIIGTLWAEGDEEEVPNERTIDVHVRRLRVEARRLRGHRAHGARRRIPVRPPRGRHHPLGVDAVARHVLISVRSGLRPDLRLHFVEMSFQSIEDEVEPELELALEAVSVRQRVLVHGDEMRVVVCRGLLKGGERGVGHVC